MIREIAQGESTMKYSGIMVPTKQRFYAPSSGSYYTNRKEAYNAMVAEMQSHMPDNYAIGTIQTIRTGSYGEVSTTAAYILEEGRITRYY
jgi:hypothetical protein